MGLVARHILFIPSWYPSDDAPLLGTFFREQAEMFVEAGHKAGVLHARFHDLPSASWLKGPTEGITLTEENGVTVIRARKRLFQPGPLHRIPPIYRASVRSREKLALKMYDAYVAKNGRPDIIHAKCTMWGAILARAISERENIPYVVTVGASIFARGIVGPRERKTAKHALESANRLLSVSSTLAEDLDRILGIPASNFTTVPNMIDMQNFPFTNPPQNDEFTFGYLANLVPDKGHDTLLHALVNVPNCKLLLGGDGPLRARLERLCNDLNLSNRVTFTGTIPRGKAHTFFEQIDAFVHPSRYETFGIVLLESLATGRPVVATRCGGPNDIVREQDGILVAVDDAEDLAKGMRQLREQEWDAPTMRTGVEERYTKDTIRNQLLEIYKTIL
ncbi:MAG: glycosyltransferase [Candidatus Thermoplasmatota archaeon]|nr:glycosyltransferase [Candidatus Thermoplasmatota archaeon]